jgi:PadR family transcriptional regulator, regulatory protein PadR
MAGELLRGHVDLLLLAVIARAATHGYALIEQLRERSGGYFDLPEGTIYPALYRLEQSGLVRSSWVEGAARPRRQYSLSPAGKAVLRERRREWDAFTAGMAAVLGSREQHGA